MRQRCSDGEDSNDRDQPEKQKIKVRRQFHGQRKEKTSNSLNKVNNFVLKYGVDKEYLPIYGVHGYKLTIFELERARNFFNQILQEKNQNFTILYFTHAKMIKDVHSTTKATDFDAFKAQVLQKFPETLLGQIKKVMVLHQSFLRRSLRRLSLHGLTCKDSKIDQKIEYASDLEQIVKVLGPAFECSRLPSCIHDYDRSEWTKIYTEEQQRNANKQLQKMLKYSEISQIPYKKYLSEYSCQNQIPKLLFFIGEIIREKYLKNEGIFRKNCDFTKLKELEYLLLECRDQDLKNLLEGYDGYVLSNSMKKVLNELEIPILKQSDIQIFKLKSEDFQSQNDSVFHYLDSQSRAVLFFVFNLCSQIIQFQSINKMGAKDLAIVLAPCLCKPSFTSLSQVASYRNCIQLLQILIRQNSQ